MRGRLGLFRLSHPDSRILVIGDLFGLEKIKSTKPMLLQPSVTKLIKEWAA